MILHEVPSPPSRTLTTYVDITFKNITRGSKIPLAGFGVFNDILRRMVCDVPTDMVRPTRYTGEILKRSISAVKPTVHANPSRKWRFSKTLFKPEEFETPACRLRVDQETF